MSRLFTYLPGLLAAVVAFIAIQVAAWLGFESLDAQALVFFIVYIIAHVFAEKAMRTYGDQRRI